LYFEIPSLSFVHYGSSIFLPITLSCYDSSKDAFNKSGGKEVITNVSASIPQGTKDYLTNAKAKLFNREHFRSPTIFFGIGEENAYFVEKTPSLLVSRLQHNVSFFYLNYAFITTLLFVLNTVTSPTTIIGMAMLGLAWMAVIRATSEGSLQLKGISISQKHATAAMTVASALWLFYLLSHVFWWTLASSAFLVGTHATFRDASMHKDEEDKIEMVGDIAISGDEDAAFLNPASNPV
jgi:hypothetical protein